MLNMEAICSVNIENHLKDHKGSQPRQMKTPTLSCEPHILDQLQQVIPVTALHAIMLEA
jgi:hypothetical protein